MMPFPPRRKTHCCGPKAQLKGNGHDKQEDVHHVKRTPSSPQGAPKKRSAFVDLTNTRKDQNDSRIKNNKPVKKTQTSKVVIKANNNLKLSKHASSEEECKKAEDQVDQTARVDQKARPDRVDQTARADRVDQTARADRVDQTARADRVDQTARADRVDQTARADRVDQTARVDQTEGSTLTDTGASVPEHPSAVQQQKIPEEFDVDKEQDDCLMSPEYAKDIFDYLRNREEKFVLTDYLHVQPDLSGSMRGILIDWMVEVQENFELNHETLYLAVKLTDHYLSVTEVMRESLQLIGSTALLIAAKFEERCPPSMDDFLYICDDAYNRQEFLVMERNILQALNFDINIPVPYRFLRRYAKVCHASMETLTLARYVCELSLLEVELVPERASCLASACLLLALITNHLGGWTAALQYHSGYTLSELGPLVRRLYAMLASPADENLRAVENKYSHKVFFEVAKIPLVHIETLEEALSEPDFALS